MRGGRRRRYIEPGVDATRTTSAVCAVMPLGETVAIMGPHRVTGLR
jgi:hypothetical protein